MQLPTDIQSLAMHEAFDRQNLIDIPTRVLVLPG